MTTGPLRGYLLLLGLLRLGGFLVSTVVFGFILYICAWVFLGNWFGS